VHSTTDISPFEIVYGFNTSTPMDLIPYPIEEMVSLDGEKKAKRVQQRH
jgi:hypothetical protein